MKPGRNRRAALAATICAIALLLGPDGAAADPPVRKVGVRGTGGAVTATFGFGDVFTPKVREKAVSGLPTRIVVQVALQPRDGGDPVTYWARSTEIVYDLWEEEFVVTVRDSRGRRSTRVETLESRTVTTNSSSQRS